MAPRGRREGRLVSYRCRRAVIAGKRHLGVSALLPVLICPPARHPVWLGRGLATGDRIWCPRAHALAKHLISERALLIGHIATCGEGVGIFGAATASHPGFGI